MTTALSLGRRPRLLPVLALGACALATLWPRSARAQAITITQTYAERFVAGKDLSESTRLLNPYGINYSDCVSDMVLSIPVSLTGFTGADTIEVWATYQGDCAFGGRSGDAPTCWLVARDPTQPVGTASFTASIPVRALVGPESGIPAAGTMVGDQGPDACTHQQTAAGLPVTIWFLPILPDGTLDGAAMPFEYPTFTADLVGPPAPLGVSIADGDTEFTVNWAANTDSDTQGYDVFIDPPPSAHPEGGTTVPTQVLYCPDTGAPAPASTEDASEDSGADSAALESGAGDDGADDSAVVVDAMAEAAPADSSTDAAIEGGAADAAADAGASPDACIYIMGGGAPPVSSEEACSSNALSAAPALEYQVSTGDDSGTSSGDAASGDSSQGGIASLPCAYLQGGTSCAAGTAAYASIGSPTVTGSSTSSLTIPGLVNMVTYNVVVAAVDSSGNVGPQSSIKCDDPVPINDFFETYRLDGGGAGGGFCALETLGAPRGASIFAVAIGALAFGFARRRRSRGRGR